MLREITISPISSKVTIYNPAQFTNLKAAACICISFCELKFNCTKYLCTYVSIVVKSELEKDLVKTFVALFIKESVSWGLCFHAYPRMVKNVHIKVNELIFLN